MTKQTLSKQQIDEIEAKVAELRTRIDRRNPWPSDNESHWTTEGWKAGTRNALDKLHVEALLAEIGRLRSELADFSGRVNELESQLCDCQPIREHDDYRRPAFYQHEASCAVTGLLATPAPAAPAGDGQQQ